MTETTNPEPLVPDAIISDEVVIHEGVAYIESGFGFIPASIVMFR